MGLQQERVRVREEAGGGGDCDRGRGVQRLFATTHRCWKYLVNDAHVSERQPTQATRKFHANMRFVCLCQTVSTLLTLYTDAVSCLDRPKELPAKDSPTTPYRKPMARVPNTSFNRLGCAEQQQAHNKHAGRRR